MIKKVLTSMTALALVFSLVTAFASVNVEAATASMTFTATSKNKPYLIVDSTFVDSRSTEAMFKVSGLPATAKITRIEVQPGYATLGGAVIFDRSWRVRLGTGSRQDVLNTSGVGYSFNGFNGSNPNNTFYVSFLGYTPGGVGSIFDPILTTGTKSYNSLKFIVHYSY